VLGRYVRDHQVLGLEEAVRKMTSLPAARLGLHDRGAVRTGGRADLVAFDPQQVRDRASFADPHQFAEGVELVVVNGRVVIEGSADTGVAAGRVLRASS
jgi:N-acyl-D-amino-acid deacylase